MCKNLQKISATSSPNPTRKGKQKAAILWKKKLFRLF